MPDQPGTGFLRVQTFFAEGAFPVEGALVTVFDEDGGIVASLRTDPSGLTEAYPLNAPAAALSQSPDAAPSSLPFSLYTVTVSKDGFYPTEDYQIPVFDSVTAIQQVNLIPLTEFPDLGPDPLPQRVQTPLYPNLTNGR